MKILDFNSKNSTDNYPYGRLKTTAYFSLEFKPNKGCRTCFQTIDPKSGRLNKPKNSTYHTLIIPIQEENGHYGYLHFDVNGRREQRKLFKFLSDESNFTAANIPKEVINNFLNISLMSLSISLGYLDLPKEEKQAYFIKYYKPLTDKHFEIIKGSCTSECFKELNSLLMDIPMSGYQKKDYIIDEKMMDGDDELKIRKQLNEMTEIEIDSIISNWEKAEALGVC